MQRMKWLGLMAVVCATFALAQASNERIIMRNGVVFTSGGIGVDSQERLQAREKEFNLKLVFTLVEGNYLADIAVAIRDAKGKAVIEHVADGPFFMAKLPAGAYSVTAIHEGKAQTRKVSVRDGRLHTEYVRWPGNPETDFPLPLEKIR